MLRSLSILTDATYDPVTLDDVKTWIRVTHSNEDLVIDRTVKKVVREIERVLGVSLITKTWRMNFDEGDAPYSFAHREIKIPMSPLTSVTALKYFGIDDAENTVATSIYDVDTEAGVVFLKDSQSWPVDLRRVKHGEIDFIAGYSDRESVPDEYQEMVFAGVDFLYHNRSRSSLPPDFFKGAVGSRNTAWL